MNNGFGRQTLPFFQANLMGGLLGNNPMSNNRVVQNVGGRWQAGAAQNKSNFVNQRNNNNRQNNNQPQRNTNGNKNTIEGNQAAHNKLTNKPSTTMNSTVQARLGPATTATKTAVAAEKNSAATKGDALVPPPSRPVLMRPGQEKITAPKQEIKAPTDSDAVAIKAHIPSAASSGPQSSVNAKVTTQIAKTNTDTSTPPPLMKKQLPSVMPTPQAKAPQKNQMVTQDLTTKPPALPNRFAHRLSAPGNRNNESSAEPSSAPKAETKQVDQQDQQQPNKSLNDNTADVQNNQQNKQMNNNRFGANNNRQGPGANKQFNNQFNNRQQNFQNRQNRPNFNQQGGYQGSNRQNEKSSGGQQRRSAGGGPNNYGQDKFWDRLHELSGPQYDLEPLDMTEQKFNAQSRLFVGSLSREGTLDELKELFSKHGELGQVYYNKEGGYAFINFDFHNNAEKAARELNNHTLRGRQIKVRFAAITTGVKVRNLPPSVTNELLFKAFGVFGPVEVSRVIVDDRGKPTGDGIVIFTEKKSAVMAFKKCQEHAYFLTNQLRPVIVEPWETRDDEEGYPEASINKNDAYMRDRKIGPRFAAPNSAESDYAKHWKQLFDIYKEKKQALESDLKAEMEALEVKMQLVIHQQETDKLRKELAQREQEARQLEMGLYGDSKLSQMTDEPPPYARGGLQVSPGSASGQVKRSHDFYESESGRGSTRYDRYGAYESIGSGYYRGAATYDRPEDSRTSSNYGTAATYGAGYGSGNASEATPVAKSLTSQPPPAITPAAAAPAAYEERTASAGAYESAEGTYDEAYGQGYESYEGSSKRGRY